MAKKDYNKPAKAPETDATLEVAAAEAPADKAPAAEAEAPAPAQEAPKSTAQDAPLVDLGTYARLTIEGYKEHWWVSIERYARDHGLKSYRVTEAKAREVLKGWGAKLK
jgi:hypothetical protein